MNMFSLRKRFLTFDFFRLNLFHTSKNLFHENADFTSLFRTHFWHHLCTLLALYSHRSSTVVFKKFNVYLLNFVPAIPCVVYLLKCLLTLCLWSAQRLTAERPSEINDLYTCSWFTSLIHRSKETSLCARASTKLRIGQRFAKWCVLRWTQQEEAKSTLLSIASNYVWSVLKPSFIWAPKPRAKKPFRF